VCRKNLAGKGDPKPNHGFHNDTTPRYDESAAKLAWQRSFEHFKKTLQQSWPLPISKRAALEVAAPQNRDRFLRRLQNPSCMDKKR
jgi:hypothetical protein